MTEEMAKKLLRVITEAIEYEFDEAELIGSSFMINNGKAGGLYFAYNIGDVQFDMSM